MEHWKAFDKLSCLKPNFDLGVVIEVGAGPWTQFKGFLNIRPDLTAKEFVVWEPSADRYMKEVSSCSYKTGYSLKKWDGSGDHPFPVRVVSSGGEKLIEPKPFDTLISINVIEHVQNVFEYLTGLYVNLKPGGLLIFHDRYYKNATITGGNVTYVKFILDKQ